MDDPLVGALDAPAKSQKILVGARESSWTASCPMDTACDRLRAKLMEFGVSRGEYGKIVLGPSSTTAFARKEVRPRAFVNEVPAAASRAGSISLHALRLVLQHCCLADRAALAPRLDATECFVVHRSDHRIDGHWSMTYGPALASEAAAVKLLRNAAVSFADHVDSVGRLMTAEDGTKQCTIQTEYGTYKFCVVRHAMRGAIEDVETVLDLATLTALRVAVAGRDASGSLGELFDAVVALRETKAPRALHAVWESSDDGGSVRSVHKTASAAARAAAEYASSLEEAGDPCDFKAFPLEVLRAAATAEAEYKSAYSRHFEGCDIGSKDYIARIESMPVIPKDLEGFVDIARHTPSDASFFMNDMEEDFSNAVIAVRPLPVAGCEAVTFSEWGDANEVTMLC